MKFILVILLLFTGVSAQDRPIEKHWKKGKAFQSNRDEVKKHLGSSVSANRATNKDSYPPNVINLILSLPEITKDCPASEPEKNNGCRNGVKVIAVFAIALDNENDVFTFDFKVSGGRIIDAGERFPIKLRNNKTAIGAKLLWDLSDVEAGSYTLTTAANDDGCFFCGQSMEKTVIVKEFPRSN